MSDEEKIIKHISKKLPGHVAEHSLRVATIAQNIANEEGADEDICYVAGLLHDLGYEKGFKNHAETGAKLAADFLKKEGLYSNLREEIVIAIRTHLLDPEPTSLEGWIVSDADIIERIGPLGIHRMYIGALYWNQLEPEDAIEYLDHALETADHIHTPTARKFARKDITYFRDYLRRVEEDSTIEEKQ